MGGVTMSQILAGIALLILSIALCTGALVEADQEPENMNYLLIMTASVAGVLGTILSIAMILNAL